MCFRELDFREGLIDYSVIGIEYLLIAIRYLKSIYYCFL